MKAIKLNKPYDVVLEDIAKPEWKKGMALLKVHSVGICGSDIQGREPAGDVSEGDRP